MDLPDSGYASCPACGRPAQAVIVELVAAAGGAAAPARGGLLPPRGAAVPRGGGCGVTNGETLVRGAEQKGVLVVGVMGFRNEGDFSLAVSSAFREWMG